MEFNHWVAAAHNDCLSMVLSFTSDMNASCHYLKKEPGSVLCLQSYQLLYPWTHGFPPKAPYRSKKLAKGRQTNKWFVASFSFPAGPLQQSLLWLQQQQQQQQQQRRQSYNLSEMMIFSKTAFFVLFSSSLFRSLEERESCCSFCSMWRHCCWVFFFLQAVAMGLRQL